jgi:hypothetical protein
VVLVADLTHFLDLPDDVPGPARRLAEQLARIVQVSTAGDAGVRWTSALPCVRRPGNRACAGRIVVQRPEAPAAVRWWCSVCDDQGAISSWEDSPYDLRRRGLAVVEDASQVILSADVAAALRDLLLLDPDLERLVFAMSAHPDGAVLTATAEELDELADSVAAEANHDSDRRRQRRLDAAFDVLSAAANRIGG